MSARLHASCVVLDESGILILGPSGAGKSRLSAALCAYGRMNGRFARLVGDDIVIVSAVSGRLVARPHPEIAGLIETRGIGLVPVAHEPAACLRLAVALGPGWPERLPPAPLTRLVCGISLPELVLNQDMALQETCLAIDHYLRPIGR